MGLTHQSTGSSIHTGELTIVRTTPQDKVIALAGNPNVGKSTVFNGLTGMNQHTGNWPGKTVTNAQGKYIHDNKNFTLVDIPGTYSLLASSVEEEVARDFICFGEPDTVVIVADATCLERNLNLILQILEVTPKVVLCVNLLDEAKKKKIQIDLQELSFLLGIPVVGTSARSGTGLEELMDSVEAVSFDRRKTTPKQVVYPELLEKAVSILQPAVKQALTKPLNERWVSFKLLDWDDTLFRSLSNYLGISLLDVPEVAEKYQEAKDLLRQSCWSDEKIRDEVVSSIVGKSEDIFQHCVYLENKSYNHRDRVIDKWLTSKVTGIPIMILLLGFIFWLTIEGANYPSELLSRLFFGFQDQLILFFHWIHAPEWLTNMLVMGVYRTLAWVISVMLPPMAIFFPLFTLLEDSGYLPRVAFNMDKFFKKANAHGKQSLTMCMGFGCNACGVIGCRIIDSPRERLIAILTNNFVPCNGRFPTLIAIITMFFAGVAALPLQSALSTLMLTGIIIFGVCMTLFTSKLLSKTVLKGIPSSFALELPPYRRPQVGKVIVRSIFDRTLFVLGRAAAVAAPAGLVIWILANVMVGDTSLLSYCTSFLDPFARTIGLDGVILMAFILGFPANEIVMPIIIMSYLCSGSIMDFDSLEQLRLLLVNHGWTWLTAVCTMLFSLLHFPCGTTCWTIYKETKSIKWTALAFLLPTLSGIVVCFLITTLARICGLV